MYETVQEANTRLAHTVILHNRNPVYVETVVPDGSKIHVVCYKLPRMEESRRVELNDIRLNLKDFQVGYMNTQYGASFGYRIPARGRFKQGLCKENTCFTSLLMGNGDRRRMDFTSAMKLPGFRDMLTGVYPSLTEAIARLKAEDAPPSVAFHRNYCLQYDSFREDFTLLYKGDNVAFGSGPDDFKLARSFNYLKEVMQTNGVRVRDDRAA